MRKATVGAVVILGLAGSALVLGPTIRAQVRGGDVRPRVERMLRYGLGSEIGVSVRELRAEEMSSAAPRPGGVFVQDVADDGPAARAGLRGSDIVTEFDGERVRGVRHFARLVQETPPGRTVPCVVIRGGERLTVDVTPQEGDRLSEVLPYIEREIERGLRTIPRDFEFEFPLRISRPRLGVSLTPLTDQLASFFGVKAGALVSNVETGSPAAHAGLRAGDVITAINGRPIGDPGDARAALRETARGSAIDVRLIRDRKELTVKATLPERDAGHENARPI